MSSSSFISLISAISGTSPVSTFPPGNSQKPAKCLFLGLYDNKISSESLINANETTILIFLWPIIGIYIYVFMG